MPPEDPPPDFVEVLARAFDVLRAVAEPDVATAADVASVVGLPVRSVRRVLSTLERTGHVRVGRGGVALTPAVLDLGCAHVQSLPLDEVVGPHLRALADRTQASTSMARLERADVLYVARISTSRIVAPDAEVGTVLPALATSLGKVLLAALDPDEVDEVLAAPSRSPVAPRWAPDRAEREQVLDEVRRRGWAATDQHLSAGIQSVAAPIHDHRETVVAALNVARCSGGWPFEAWVSATVPDLLATAQAVTVELRPLSALPHVRLGGLSMWLEDRLEV